MEVESLRRVLGECRILRVLRASFLALLCLTSFLAAEPFNEFVLLIDTSLSMTENQRFANLKVALDDFADTIPPDGMSRIWLFTFDDGLHRDRAQVVLRSDTEKKNFKVALMSIPSPAGRQTRTWTALRDVMAEVKKAYDGRTSRSASIHLFTDGEPTEKRPKFADAFGPFSELRSQFPELRLYYHAIDCEVPKEVLGAALPESGLLIIRGLAMPPQIVPERVFAGEIGETGVARIWKGAAIGSVERWQWDFGDGVESNETDPTHTYVRSGKYVVKVRASNPSGDDTRTFNLNVRSGPPKPDFSVAGRYAGSPTLFTDQSSGEISRREWRMGDNMFGDQPVLKHTFSGAGVFRISLVAVGPGGSNSVTREVRIELPPNAAFSHVPVAPVKGQAVTFVNESANLSEPWTWVFGDGASSTERTPKHVYAAEGRWGVVLTGRDPEGKILRCQREIEVLTDALPPVAVIVREVETGRSSPLVGMLIPFRSACSGTVERCEWDFGDDSKTTGVAVRHAYGKAGNYTVGLTAVGPAGSNHVSVPVTVMEPMMQMVANPTPVMMGRKISFIVSNAPPHLAGVAWDFGDGNLLTNRGDNALCEHVYGAEGTFLAKATVVLQDGSDSPVRLERHLETSLQVFGETVNVAFVAHGERARLLKGDGGRRILRGPVPLTVRFENRCIGAIAGCRWDFGDSVTSDDPSPTRSYGARGTYKVRLSVTDHFQREYSTTESTGFTIEVTGWRPPKEWRWPAIVIFYLLLHGIWRISPVKRRRVTYMGDGRRKTHSSWLRDLTIRNGNISATVRLSRNAWLRKRYALVAGSDVQWANRRGERPKRSNLMAGDVLTVGDQKHEIVALNQSMQTGLLPIGILLATTAVAARFAWNYFV